jgi:hypothetical protein
MMLRCDMDLDSFIDWFLSCMKNSFASMVSKTADNRLGFEEGKKNRKYDKNYSIAGIAITKNKYRYLLPLRFS